MHFVDTRWPARRRPRLVGLHAALTAVNLCLALLVYVGVPALRPELYREGHIVETLSALLFLTGFGVGAAALHRVPAGRRIRYAAIPALGLMGFLDEMSFGAAELGFTPPRVLDVKLDGVHDILLVAEALIRSGPGWLLTLTATAGVGLGLLVVRRRERFLIPVLGAIRTSSTARFMAVFAVFVTIALIQDIVRIDSELRRTVEEVFEMNGGLALLFAALTMAGAGRQETADEQPETASPDAHVRGGV
jgi:hypothetical protein